jgi:hypothetical protein
MIYGQQNVKFNCSYSDSNRYHITQIYSIISKYINMMENWKGFFNKLHMLNLPMHSMDCKRNNSYWWYSFVLFVHAVLLKH